MRFFRNYPEKSGSRPLLKMEHYLGIYDKVLEAWRKREVSFLEIGVYKGGSIQMWKRFFAKESRLTFIDIDPSCASLALPGTTVRIGDQTDESFLESIAADHGPFDLIIDDGGHMMDQQITSFKNLWPKLNNNGLYIVEDTHTSYWPGFGGGLKKSNSFIEFAKNLIDDMHSWYTDDDKSFPFNPIAREIGYIHFYDSMTVIEKQLKEPPVSLEIREGKVNQSKNFLSLRNRRSIFEKTPPKR